ncbi:MAG: NADP-dependent oxidoreductase, partial [Abditibacteriaceae bacterium]
MSAKNHQVLLASRPNGEPTPENFEYVENEKPTPHDGQVLLRTIY